MYTSIGFHKLYHTALQHKPPFCFSTIIVCTWIKNLLSDQSVTVTIDLPHYCRSIFSSLFQNTRHIFDWGSRNLVPFNVFKTEALSISLEHSPGLYRIPLLSEHHLIWSGRLSKINSNAFFRFPAKWCQGSSLTNQDGVLHFWQVLTHIKVEVKRVVRITRVFVDNYMEMWTRQMHRRRVYDALFLSEALRRPICLYYRIAFECIAHYRSKEYYTYF